MSKISLNEIRSTLAEDGWTLISETYKNLDTDMEYKCNSGHIVIAPWKKIRVRRECPTCNKNINLIKSKIGKKKKDEFRILALDQATHISGYSLFSNKELIDFGKFEVNGNSDFERSLKVKEWLINLIDKFDPDFIGLEGIQYQQSVGVTTFETLARLQGVLGTTCLELGIPFKVVNTNTWRNHCGVKGKSRIDKKRSMQLLVQEWFDMRPSEDECDAIGIGKYFCDTQAPKVEMVEWGE